MDGVNKKLDNTNIGAIGERAMSGIPTYALYGEFDEHIGADWLHCETIHARSHLHDFRIRPHRHERFFQILHLHSGSGRFSVDGQTAAIEPPCLIFVPAMVVHGFVFSHDITGRILTLYAEHLPSLLRASPEILPRLSSPVRLALDPKLAAGVAAELEMIAQEFDLRLPARLAAIEARLSLVLIACHRAAGPTSKRRNDGPHGHVAQFQHMVDAEFRLHRSLALFARRLGITTTHLNRLCRSSLGDTALGVINRRLILEAKRHLAFTMQGVKGIAAELGFEDPAYFTRFFIRQTGISPLGFRAKHRMRGTE
jgi:AraC family transcriptional regulator, transcriptional activator of pobA